MLKKLTTCPGCNTPRESNSDPRPLGEELCLECHRLAGWHLFDIYIAPMIGSTVERVEPPTEIYDRDCARRLYLRDTGGGRWLVTSDTDVYVYRVDEDGKLLEEPTS